MRNKMMFLGVFAFACMACANVRADVIDEIDEVVEIEDIDDLNEQSAAAVSNYDVSGSLFQQITDLEQEKVLMQLEKERAQLDLELDRLAAEKIRLHMEIETLSGRAEQAQAEIDAEKAKLEAEAARLAKEKENLQSQSVTTSRRDRADNSSDDENSDVDLNEMYRLVNVFGAGSQLQATVADLSSGQNKRLSVGKTLDGFTVKSISLDDGVVFVKDGVTQSLNVGSNR